jgi:hypothetical protein
MNMRFEVLTAVKMLILVFWVVTSYGHVGRYQHFRGTYCLHLQPLDPILSQMNPVPTPHTFLVIFKIKKKLASSFQVF